MGYAVEDIVACVVERGGTLPFDLWPASVSLESILQDFDAADLELSFQDKQRYVVSRAWMMRLLHDAVGEWIFKKYRSTHSCFKKTGDPKLAFTEEIVLKKLQMSTPRVSIRSYRLGNKYADYLKHLETSVYQGLLPYSIDAFERGEFGAHTDDARTEVLRLCVGPVSKRVMPAALEAYKLGKRAADPSEVPNVITISDVYDKGKSVAEIRDSDNFINISSFFDRATNKKKTYKAYKDAAGTRTLLRSFTVTSNSTLIDKPPVNSLGTYWAHHKVAIHVAKYCELPFDLEHLLRHLPDDSTPTEATSTRVPDANKIPDDLILYEVLDKDGGHWTVRRSTDDFIDVSQLSKCFTLTWYEFYKLEFTRQLREKIAYDLIVDVNTLVQDDGGQTFVYPEIALEYILHATKDNVDKEEESVIRKRLFDTTIIFDTFTPVLDTKTGNYITVQRSSDGFYNTTMIYKASGRTRSECNMTAWFYTKAGQELKQSVEKAVEGPWRKETRGLYGGTYVHALVAEPYATRCKLNLSLSEM